jgi:hypothetical protein
MKNNRSFLPFFMQQNFEYFSDYTKLTSLSEELIIESEIQMQLDSNVEYRKSSKPLKELFIHKPVSSIYMLKK